MTKKEIVKKIWLTIYSKLLDILLKGEPPSVEFEADFERMVRQKERGVRVFYPTQMLPEFCKAFLVAVGYTITRYDGNAARYNTIAADMAMACAASCITPTVRKKEFTTQEYSHLAQKFNAEIAEVTRFISDAQNANPAYYKSFGKGGLTEAERQAYADQAWALNWLENKLLGEYSSKENFGKLCLPHFKSILQDLAANAYKTLSEFMEPSSNIVISSYKSEVMTSRTGCMIPFALITAPIVARVYGLLRILSRS